MKKIVIIPGGFHPFHAGHLALYNKAKENFPDAEVFVAATDDTSERPFSFDVKQQLAHIAGVKRGNFVKVKSPFKPTEITDKYDPNDTIVIYVKSEKNAKSGSDPEGPFPAEVDPKTGKLPLVTRGPNKGQPISNWLQYYKSDKPLEPMSKHGYLAYLPTVEFGPGLKNAKDIRKLWPGLNDNRKLALIMSMYPITQKNRSMASKVAKIFDKVLIQPQPQQPVSESLDYLPEK